MSAFYYKTLMTSCGINLPQNKSCSAKCPEFAQKTKLACRAEAVVQRNAASFTEVTGPN